MSRGDGRTTKVYVGGLPPDARKEELEREFAHYGKLQDVWVARNPPGFAFVEFYDEKDAKDACDDLDGRTLCGERVRVELSHGRTRGRGRGRGGGRSDRRDDRYRDRYDDRRQRSRSPRGNYSPSRGGRNWKSRSRSPDRRF